MSSGEINPLMNSKLIEALLSLVEAQVPSSRASRGKSSFHSSDCLSAVMFESQFGVRRFKGTVNICNAKHCKDPIIIGRRKLK